MIGIVVILPQTDGQLLTVGEALQTLHKAAQIDFIQIRQPADNFERLFRRNIEIIGGFIADNDFHLFPVPQQAADNAYQC